MPILNNCPTFPNPKNNFAHNNMYQTNIAYIYVNKVVIAIFGAKWGVPYIFQILACMLLHEDFYSLDLRSSGLHLVLCLNGFEVAIMTTKISPPSDCACDF